MNAMRKGLARRAAWTIALAVATLAQAEPAAPAPAEWVLSLPAGERVRYEGLVNLDNAGAQHGGFMYVAPGLIGLVAAVATHGAITSSVRNAEKTRLQDEANEVLKPYRPVIDAMGDEALLQEGAKRLNNTATQAGWRLESLPVFRLTQDQTAFVLDHAVRIRHKDAAAAAPMFEGTIRVVSTPLEGDTLQERWLASDGQLLKDTLAQLYAQSLAIAAQRANGSTAATGAPMRTVRYDEGRSVRVERARVIEAGCDRWVIENLRGWWLSVPVRKNGDACPDSATAAPQPR
jgi:hypothetical protein